MEEEKAGTSSWLKKRKKNKRMRTFRSSPNIEEREGVSARVAMLHYAFHGIFSLMSLSICSTNNP